MNFLPQNVPQKFKPLLLCQICGMPVPVETSKTDAEGKAIHEDCYIKTMALEQAIRERRTL
jgi:hypothetical protein